MAAYFADALRSGDARWSALPGGRPLGELASRTRDLARATDDKDVEALATAIGQADDLNVCDPDCLR